MVEKAEISVELVDSMGSDLSVANTARVSFNKWKDEFEVGKDDRLIAYLANHEHLSPFRHTQISIRCKVPVFLARQLGKHQAGLSWNEVSRRYVDASIEFFVPDSWRSRPADGIKQGSGEEYKYQGAANSDYQYILEQCQSMYDSWIKQGVAPEMARMILPQSMIVDYVWTGNLLAFFHVYRLRAGEGAQVEAKEFAEKLKTVIEPLFPVCWKALEEAKQ
jgi:thymidylate synthase (FAD)